MIYSNEFHARNGVIISLELALGNQMTTERSEYSKCEIEK